MSQAILNEISMLLQQGRAPKVVEAVKAALEQGVGAKDILEEGLLAGMNVIGEKFKNNEVFVPEVLIAARAMNRGIAQLKPHLAEGDVEERGTVVIGTVKGDLHDIGKNLVRMMMEGKGLNVIDLGTDVDAERYIAAAREHDADIIACSALLTTTMGEMRTVVEKATEAGIRDRVRIMIGGAPITQQYCDQIGADAYTPDASTAAEVALKFCTGA
ncbi:MAG: corrinoid protein [Bacillota bacterium]|nr:corrinoid protein [Bacillota bacterium]